MLALRYHRLTLDSPNMKFSISIVQILSISHSLLSAETPVLAAKPRTTTKPSPALVNAATTTVVLLFAVITRATAAAVVSQPALYSKELIDGQPVGPTMVHPSGTASQGPSWKALLESGVKHTLAGGVGIHILRQDFNLSDANGTRKEAQVRHSLFNGHKASLSTSRSSSKDALTNCVRE